MLERSSLRSDDMGALSPSANRLAAFLHALHHLLQVPPRAGRRRQSQGVARPARATSCSSRASPGAPVVLARRMGEGERSLDALRQAILQALMDSGQLTPEMLKVLRGESTGDAGAGPGDRARSSASCSTRSSSG